MKSCFPLQVESAQCILEFKKRIDEKQNTIVVKALQIRHYVYLHFYRERVYSSNVAI